MKFKNPFKLLQPKSDYREKDQRIVTRWLQECEDEKLDADELLNLSIRFMTMVIVTCYEPTTWSRKSILKKLDTQLKQAMDVYAKALKQANKDKI